MVASTAIGHPHSLTCSGTRFVFPYVVAVLLLASTPKTVWGESATDKSDPFETATNHEQPAESRFAIAADPFDAEPAVYDPFDTKPPLDVAAYAPKSTIVLQHELVFLQPPSNEAGVSSGINLSPGAQTVQGGKQQVVTDPCAGAPDKPLYELGINIVLPSGLLPKDHAALCWAERNAIGGPFAAIRGWPVMPYYWDAPCLCYRPLYFEEINLERHGYGCCACIQPAISAAHFFGTIPALPYCMAEHCPCGCEYTLGHYRPGSCPPWRHHWPSCKPIAAAAEAGVVTGLIFAIP